MKKIIAINALTLLRIPLSILFYLTLFTECNQVIICTILFIFVIGTDFFDGKLARKYNVETKVGATLDVSADFLFIFVASYGLHKQNLFPLGLLLIILLKFMEFIVTSYLVKPEEKNGRAFLFDNVGKFLAIVFYLLPIFIIVIQPLVSEFVFSNLMMVILVFIGMLGLVSLWGRMKRIIL